MSGIAVSDGQGDRDGGRVLAAGLAILGWLVKFVMVVVVIATVNFMLVHAAPGDPAQVIAGQSGAADEKLLAQLRADYGLDKPYPVQLANYLGRVLTLDLGFSYRQNAPVLTVILEQLPATVILMLAAPSIALLVGVTAGVLASVKVNTVWIT